MVCDDAVYGKYFTTSPILQEKIFEFILNKPKIILEPSVGRGDLVAFINKQNKKIKFDMYEIDPTIELLEGIESNQINYTDFTSHEITKKYKTIIGNPPYAKPKNKKHNIYIDFTKKCYDLLSSKGELIFIVPSDFFQLTSTANLL